MYECIIELLSCRGFLQAFVELNAIPISQDNFSCDSIRKSSTNIVKAESLLSYEQINRYNSIFLVRIVVIAIVSMLILYFDERKTKEVVVIRDLTIERIKVNSRTGITRTTQVHMTNQLFSEQADIMKALIEDIQDIRNGGYVMIYQSPNIRRKQE